MARYCGHCGQQNPDDGLYCDRFWDAVNATRAKAGQPLLYAVANDDCHFYPCTKTDKPCPFGEAYTVVRAAALTPAALFEAMEKGDSYASCGVDLEDVRFDGKTLYVSVPAKKGVTYTIKFITTKRGVDTGVVHTVSVASAVTVGKIVFAPAATASLTLSGEKITFAAADTPEVEVGANGTLYDGVAGGVGFTAITVAWLSQLNAFGMIAISMMLAIIAKGAETLQTRLAVPASISGIITGILLFCMLGCEFFINYRMVFRKQRGERAKHPADAGKEVA